MPATPADIAAYTNDGVVLTAPTDATVSAAISATHIDARTSDGEIEMFYDLAGDAQIMLTERFSYLSIVDPVHLGIEVEEAIALGDTIPIAPTVPTFGVIDDTVGLNASVRCRAYAHDMGTDRFSVEVLS
jgi:hypothetical protein